MRATPLPLFRNLAPCVVVERCVLCNELALMRERCRDQDEAKSCPSRAEVEARPPLFEKIVTLHERDGRLTISP